MEAEQDLDLYVGSINQGVQGSLSDTRRVCAEDRQLNMKL
jgi:hypothetical protein